jgi:hypothetical protein
MNGNTCFCLRTASFFLKGMPQKRGLYRRARHLCFRKPITSALRPPLTPPVAPLGKGGPQAVMFLITNVIVKFAGPDHLRVDRTAFAH